MFTNAQQKALELLNSYLSSKPIEEIKAEMEVISRISFTGPTIEEYFMNFHTNIQGISISFNKKTQYKSQITKIHYPKITRLKMESSNLSNNHLKEQKSYNRLTISQ